MQYERNDGGEKVDEIVRYDYDPLGRIIKVTINNKKQGKRQ